MFQEFYDSNYTYAVRTASRVSPLYAEDAVQDVFAYLWEADDQRKLTRAYLAKAVKNRVLYYIKNGDPVLADTWDEPDSSLSPEPYLCNEEANKEYADFIMGKQRLSDMLTGNWTGRERGWLFRNKGKLREELIEVIG